MPSMVTAVDLGRFLRVENAGRKGSKGPVVFHVFQGRDMGRDVTLEWCMDDPDGVCRGFDFIPYAYACEIRRERFWSH